jgi:hypothetical protein
MPFFSFAAAHGVRGGVAIYAPQDLNISAHGNALQHIYLSTTRKIQLICN